MHFKNNIHHHQPKKRGGDVEVTLDSAVRLTEKRAVVATEFPHVATAEKKSAAPFSGLN